MKANIYKSKLLLVLLLVSFALTASGCGQENATSVQPESQPAATAVTETEPKTEPVTEPALDINKEVDSFLVNMPSNFYAVGKIDAVKDLINNSGALVVDLREPADYAAGHIPGAISIPIRDLTKNLDKLPKDKPILLTCASGYRAGLALSGLQMLGYSNARSYPGSYKGWTDAKEPVSTDAVEAKVVGEPDVNKELVAKMEAFFSALPDNFYSVSKIDAFKEMVANGAVVVDLRPADEYAEGHIPSALNIPINELSKNLDKLPKDKPVVMSCASGHRAALATTALHLLDYTNVRAFPPSFGGWKAANEEIEGKALDINKVVEEYLTTLPESYYNVGKVETLKEMLANGALLIDVREEAEYAEGHIPGAVNIPIRTLAKNLDKVPADKPVVLSCASGLRCTIGTASLQMLGYKNVRTFFPSYKGWTAANEAVDKEPVAPVVVGEPKVDKALLEKVDAFLSGLPENYYSVGKVEALKDMVANAGAVVIDVREASEYAEGRIPGAVNIPIRELTKNLDKLPKDKTVVLSCASGLRCTLAMPALQLLGYSNVRTFPPSYKGWAAANEAVEK